MRSHIIFPKPYFSSADILIEEFMENSESVSEFAKRGFVEVNKKIAKLGVNVIYKMVIYDNFVHADCHGGNIFVK
jgi:aarF domain-containing kinase